MIGLRCSPYATIAVYEFSAGSSLRGGVALTRGGSGVCRTVGQVRIRHLLQRTSSP